MPWVLLALCFSKQGPLSTCIKSPGECTKVQIPGHHEGPAISESLVLEPRNLHFPTLPGDSDVQNLENHCYRWDSQGSFCMSAGPSHLPLGGCLDYTCVVYYKALVFLLDHWVDVINEHCGPVEWPLLLTFMSSCSVDSPSYQLGTPSRPHSL